MDKDTISILGIGTVAVAMAILGKFRPDIIFRNARGKQIAPENQRFLSFAFLLYGIMFVLIAIALGVPRLVPYKGVTAVSIAVFMTVILLIGFWAIKYRNDERLSRLVLVGVLVASMALVGFCIYYWTITLN